MRWTKKLMSYSLVGALLLGLMGGGALHRLRAEGDIPSEVTPEQEPGAVEDSAPSVAPDSSPSETQDPIYGKDYRDAFRLLQSEEKDRNVLEVERGSSFEFKAMVFQFADEPLKILEAQIGPYVEKRDNPPTKYPFYLTPEPIDRDKPFEIKPDLLVDPARDPEQPQAGGTLNFGRFKMAEDAPSPNYIGMKLRYVDRVGREFTQDLYYELKTKPQASKPSEPTEPGSNPSSTRPSTPGEEEGAKLDLVSSASSRIFRPNERRDLKVSLKNTGSVPVTVTRLELLATGGLWPFSEPNASVMTKTQVALKPGQGQELTLWELRTLDELDDGKYPLVLAVSYRLQDGTEQRQDFSYEVTGMTMSPTEPTEPSESTEPTGPTKPTEPTDSSHPSEPSKPEEPTESTTTDDLGGDDAGGWFSGGGGGGWGGPAETIPDPVPRLLLDSFKTNPGTVLAGDPFTLKLKLRNTSQTAALRNIQLTLSADENAFLPESGSSTLFLSGMDKESVATVEIRLKPQASLEQRPYAMTLAMQYEDEKGKALEGTETLAIPVYQESRAEIGQVEFMPQSATVGNQINVMFSVINKGKNKLYNVTVQAVPEGSALEIPQTYIGNIEPGAQGSVDLMATAMAPFMDEESIVVQYEDELGEVTELKHTIGMNDLAIMEWEEPPMDFPGDPFNPEENPDIEEPERQSLETWQYVAIGGGSLLVLGFVIGGIRRKRRRKREAIELGLEEDDF